MSIEPRRKKSSAPWVAVSMTAGVAFAIVAILNAPGIAYVIVAILAALAYSLVTMWARRQR
jgi:Flp pilus assembly protein TadB